MADRQQVVGQAQSDLADADAQDLLAERVRDLLERKAAVERLAGQRELDARAPRTRRYGPAGRPPAAAEVVLIVDVRACRVSATPGTLSATVPESVPTVPAGVSSSVPLPSVIESSGASEVPPSLSSRLSTSIWTIEAPAGSVDFVIAKSPWSVWPRTEMSMSVPATRTNGPASTCSGNGHAVDLERLVDLGGVVLNSTSRPPVSDDAGDVQRERAAERARHAGRS